jgi:hypothetical protein
VSGRYRPLLLESLAQAPGGQPLPLADLTGLFVHCDRSAVYKQEPALISGGPGRRSVMTVLQKPPHGDDRHAARGWFKLGHGDQAVRHTDAWEHETFAEEQARWERSDPEYARICEQVRQARQRGEDASRRADQAKAEWDARVATRRQADDDAQRARNALKAEQSALRQTAASRVLALRRQQDLETRVAGRAVGDLPGRARAPSGHAPRPGSHDARRQRTRRDPQGTGRRSLDERGRQPWP